MKISYLGHSAVFITASNGESLIFDPFTKIGYEMCPVFPTVCSISHNHYDHNFIQGAIGAKEIVYDKNAVVGAFIVQSFKSFHDEEKGKLRGDNFIKKVTVDGVSVCHMGDFGENPEDFDFSPLKNVDLLFIPVGGNYTIDAKNAFKCVQKINPKFIIPIHYKTEKSKIDIALIDEFLSLFDKKDISQVNSSVDFSDLKTKVTVMLIKED